MLDRTYVAVVLLEVVAWCNSAIYRVEYCRLDWEPLDVLAAGIVRLCDGLALAEAVAVVMNVIFDLLDRLGDRCLGCLIRSICAVGLVR